MSWRQDSTAGAAIWDTEPMSGQDLLCRDEELRWLMNHGKKQWELINGRIARKGDPTAALGSYGGLMAYPPNAAQTSTALATSTPGSTIWTVATYSPILANAVMAPSGYRITASGTIQTSTSGLTVTALPSIGSGSVNAAPTTYQTLGVSGASGTLGTSLTGGWNLMGELTIRSTGTAGTAWFSGQMTYTTTTLPAAASATGTLLLGGTVATVDFTGATANYPGGMQLSMFGAATVTIVTNSVHFTSWN